MNGKWRKKAPSITAVFSKRFFDIKNVGGYPVVFTTGRTRPMMRILPGEIIESCYIPYGLFGHKDDLRNLRFRQR